MEEAEEGEEEAARRANDQEQNRQTSGFYALSVTGCYTYVPKGEGKSLQQGPIRTICSGTLDLVLTAPGIGQFD